MTRRRIAQPEKTHKNTPDCRPPLPGGVVGPASELMSVIKKERTGMKRREGDTEAMG